MPRQTAPFVMPPVPPLNLEEVRFWLKIMEEHALFIKAGLPADRTDLIEETQSFHREFAALCVKADRVNSEKRFLDLVSETMDTVRNFRDFIYSLVSMTLTYRLSGANFSLFLDHMGREAEYFLRMLEQVRAGKQALAIVSKTHENAFWVRVMADHTKFIRQRLDPSERIFISTTEGYSREFDDLLLEGRDFVSMLHLVPPAVEAMPVFSRYLMDVRAATIRLRDYKAALERLVKEERIAGLLPALLVDHLRREADHFLMVLGMMEKSKGPLGDAQAAEMAEMMGEPPLSPAIPAPPPIPKSAAKGGSGKGVIYGPDFDDDELDDDIDRPAPAAKGAKPLSVSMPKEAVKEQPKENLEEKPEEKLSAAFGAGAEGAAEKTLTLSQEKETEWEENDDLEQLEDTELIQPRPPQAPPEPPALDLLPVPPAMPEADLPPPKQPQSQLETKLEPKEEIKPAAKQPLPKQVEHKPIGKSAKDTKESKYKWSGKWPRPLGR